MHSEEFKQIISIPKCFPNLSYRDYLMFRFALKKMDKWPNQREIFALFEHLIRKSMVQYLYRLVKIDLQTPKDIYSFIEEYTKIFETLYLSGDKKIQNGTSKMINELGEQGYFQFREIYERYLNGEFA